MNQLKANPDFNFHMWCEKLNISHMMFASNSLLFSRDDEVSVKLLLEAFQKFSNTFGLEANISKSNIYIYIWGSFYR